MKHVTKNRSLLPKSAVAKPPLRVFPFAHYRKYRQIVVMVSPSALQLGHALPRVMESHHPTAPAMLSKHPHSLSMLSRSGNHYNKLPTPA